MNCDLSRKGNRRRRLGIAYEDNYVLSGATVNQGSLVSTGTWESVSGIAGLQYLVVQLGANLYFYNKAILPLSAQAVPISLTNPLVYTVDLTSFEVAGLGGAAFAKVSVTSIDGALVVVSAAIEPFFIERDPDTGGFTETQITMKVRDFAYQGTKSTYFDAELNPDSNRQYDTKNTGWVDTIGDAALTTYKNANGGKHPPLTHAWFSAKNTSGNFDAAAWAKVFSGTSLIATGHYILDLFDKDRDTASSLTGLTREIEPSRFQTITTYAGRAWYAGLSSSRNGSKIYFSRLGGELEELGQCYQVTDPTSEDAVLLDTDGGTITVSGAYNVSKIAVLGPSLVVFAENGVWNITGVNDVFRASEFSINKITDIGLINPSSFVDAEGSFIWWSPSGIHTLSYDPKLGRPVENNISISTIQTFWDNIGVSERNSCIAEYDYVNKKVFWVFPSVGETVDYKLNRVLVLDTILQAFYPWSISDQTSNTNYIVGTSFFKGVGSGQVEFNVVDSSGNQVIDSSGNNVTVVQQGQVESGNSDILFMVRDGATGKITFANFSSTTFLDWEDTDYSSFAEAGYDFNGDISTRKTSPFISVLMGVTETGWTGSESLGYTRVRPSSLKVSAYWDFKDTASSTPQEAYRLKTMPVVDPLDLSNFNYPTTVISTRLKLRGRGQSVRLRFASEQGKDFNLLGYEMIGERSNKL